jgi:hypothetical protein
MPFTVVLLNASAERRVYPVPPGKKCYLGGRYDVDVHVPNLAVHRPHAEVWQEGSQLQLRDCNTRSGVWVQRMRLPNGVAVPLQAWDVFFLATVPLRVVPPGAVDQAWLTWRDGTVSRLAARIQARHDFEALPILADALEDAGCSEAHLLNHCRQPAVERMWSSWVADLLCAEAGHDPVQVPDPARRPA